MDTTDMAKAYRFTAIELYRLLACSLENVVSLKYWFSSELKWENNLWGLLLKQTKYVSRDKT